MDGRHFLEILVQDVSLFMVAEGWIMNTYDWFMVAERWIMNTYDWFMVAEGWIMNTYDLVYGSRGVDHEHI